MRNIYLVGAGGHCISCIDVIEVSGQYSIKGIFDVSSKVGGEVLGYPIIGSDENIKDYVSTENFFLVTVGQIKSPAVRTKIYDLLISKGANLATVVSTRAHVSKHASLGVGTIVMHDALVNANAMIGKNCIINSKSLIEHDVHVHDHCHISTAAIVNGNCEIGPGSFVGSNSVLKEGCKVPGLSVLRAGEFHK